jgi:hypothetical protein
MQYCFTEAFFSHPNIWRNVAEYELYFKYYAKYAF